MFRLTICWVWKVFVNGHFDVGKKSIFLKKRRTWISFWYTYSFKWSCWICETRPILKLTVHWISKIRSTIDLKSSLEFEIWDFKNNNVTNAVYFDLKNNLISIRFNQAHFCTTEGSEIRKTDYGEVILNFIWKT